MRKSASRRYHRAIFAPNLENHGMNTERYEALVSRVILGPCSCNRRLILAGFPIVGGQPQIHQHVAVIHNPYCPVHGVEGSRPISWSLDVPGPVGDFSKEGRPDHPHGTPWAPSNRPPTE